MYPYTNPVKWLLAHRFDHLVRGVRQLADVVPGPEGARLDRRLRAMERWGRTRGILLMFLYFGIIASIALWFFDQVPETDALEAVIRWVASITSAFSGLLFASYVFLTRLLGQLEADTLALLFSHLSKDRDTT